VGDLRGVERYELASRSLIGSDAPTSTGAGGPECSDDARFSRAVLRCPGSSRPRRSARRRIPVAAFGLKKYFDRCGPVSKTSGKEDTVTSLGDSEVLSVQHSPAKAIPELLQRPDDGTHCPSVGLHAAVEAGTALRGVTDVGSEDADSVALLPSSAPNSAPCSGAGVIARTRADGRQETGDVLKKEPPWAQLAGQPHDVPEQPRTCAVQARAASRHRKILAGPSAGEDSPSGNKSGCSKLVTGNLRHIVEKLRLGEVAAQVSPAPLIDLDRCRNVDASTAHGQVEPADTGKQGDCGQAHPEPPAASAMTVAA
jgi:hypothetical protein